MAIGVVAGVVNLWMPAGLARVRCEPKLGWGTVRRPCVLRWPLARYPCGRGTRWIRLQTTGARIESHQKGPRGALAG